MSFMKTMINVGIGFAAAKGLEKYQRMGGMAGLKAKMGDMQSGGMAENLGNMAEKMGLPGGRDGMTNMMNKFGLGGTGTDAAMAGMGGMMAAAGNKWADVFETVTKDTQLEVMAEENARLMIRAMIQAAKADGQIDAEEQAKIIEHLGEATPEEMAFVKEQLEAPLDVTALAKDAGAQSREQVYRMSLMAITVDNIAEAQYLQSLAAALGLDGPSVQQIHQEMGITSPAS
ncbi:MAG: DUF533 domain-containing protein [Mangrovicoccus sp.]